MPRAWYLAEFEMQLTGSACAPYNAGMAAATMAARQLLLGAIDTSADDMRTHSGVSTDCANRAQGRDESSVHDAANALARKGIHLTVFDPTDTKGFDDLIGYLQEGRFAICHGDYGLVPRQLRGPEDPLGQSTVFFHEYREDVTYYNGHKGKAIRVGDGLNDGRSSATPRSYQWWPELVARRYAESPLGGKRRLTFGVINKRRLVARVDAKVRAEPSVGQNVIRTVPQGTNLVWGAAQIGEPVGPDRRWYRVWEPEHAKVGFMHASVVDVLST